MKETVEVKTDTMTRERFITKWLGNEAAKYTEEFRDLMRDDLDKVIDYHSVSVVKSSCKCEVKMVNAEWTHLVCLKCGKRHEPGQTTL